jgi:glycosyltransferase involved in cell wall biosynthesis
VKVAWLSNVLPPSHTAHAAIVMRLLRGRDPDSYCLLSGRDYVQGTYDAVTERLPGRYFHVQSWRITRGYRFGMARVRHALNLVLDMQRALLIARILRREGCDALVACTGGDEIVDFPAGFLATRMLGIPFYAYLLDQFSHMVNFGMGTSVLRVLEPVMMKRAAGVVVPNEFLAAEVARRFGIAPVLIHNPCDLAVYDSARAAQRTDGGVEFRILYGGSVDLLQLPALRNLVMALRTIPGDRCRLHVHSEVAPAVLEAKGLTGPVVFPGLRPLAEMPALQKAADVLFLPLALHSPHPEIVRTAAPGKMGEYLAARRPILVHAPADSFVAWYFRRHECGLVVDRDDPDELANAVRRLMQDESLRRELSERAGERARADFSLTKARDQFDTLLGWRNER